MKVRLVQAAVASAMLLAPSSITAAPRPFTIKPTQPYHDDNVESQGFQLIMYGKGEFNTVPMNEKITLQDEKSYLAFSIQRAQGYRPAYSCDIEAVGNDVRIALDWMSSSGVGRALNDEIKVGRRPYDFVRDVTPDGTQREGLKITIDQPIGTLRVHSCSVTWRINK